MSASQQKQRPAWKVDLEEIIFEADTPMGRFFDVALIIAILLSVMVIMMESVEDFRLAHGEFLRIAEWIFTILFTIEYFLRLICVSRPLKYATSFFGLVDLLSVIPTYLSLILPASQYLSIIRVLRILRVFRILKLVKFVSEAQTLTRAIRGSSRKIFVFMYTVLILATIMGCLMYVVEGEVNGFTSIPRSIYWAIVTLTTVGYGDIAPQTNLGQTIAAVLMIMGYGIIAVPTGIVTTEFVKQEKTISGLKHCPECGSKNHDVDALYCKYCSTKL